MEVVYVGPHGVVEVSLRPGFWVEAQWGKPVEVPAEIGKGLLEQPSNWKAVEPAADEKKSSPKEK